MNMASPVVLKVLAPSSVAGQHSGEKSELTCTSITSNGPRSRESTTSPLPLQATSLPLLSSKVPAPVENGMPPCSVGEAPSSAPKQAEELKNEFVAEMTAQVASSVHSGTSQLASTLNPMSSFSTGTDLLAPMNELLAPISAGADLLVPSSTVEDLLAPVSTSPPELASTFNLGAMEVSPVSKADDVVLSISNGAEIHSVLDKDIKVASSVYVTTVACTGMSTGMEVAPVVSKPADTGLMDTTPAQIFPSVTTAVMNLIKEPSSAVTAPLSIEPASAVTVPLSNEPTNAVTPPVSDEPATVSKGPATAVTGAVTAPLGYEPASSPLGKGTATAMTTAPLINEPSLSKGPASTVTAPFSNEPAVAVTALLNAVSAVTAGARVIPTTTSGAKNPASTMSAVLPPTISAPNSVGGAWTNTSAHPVGGTPSTVTAPGPTASLPRFPPYFTHTGAMKGTPSNPVPGLPRTGTVTATISAGGGPTAGLGAGKPPGIVVGSSLARSSTGATTIASGPPVTKPPTMVTIAAGMGRSGGAGIPPAISSGIGVPSAIIAGAGLPRTINIGGPSISAATPIGPTITKAAGIPPTVSITPIHVETTKEPAPLNLAPKVVRAEPVSAGATIIPGVSIALAASNPAPFKPNISGPPKPPTVPPIAAIPPKSSSSAPAAPILPKPTSSVPPPKPTTSTSIPPRPTVPSKPTTSTSVPPKPATSTPAPPKPTTSAPAQPKPSVLPSTAMLVSKLASNLSRDELASMVSMAVAQLQGGDQRLDKALKPATEPARVSPPSLHANEEMLAEDSEEDEEEEMDTETSSQISDVAPPTNSAHPLQASSSSLPPSTRSGSTSPYADDESFAMFVAQEASETACALDPETSSLSPSPSPTPTPIANEMLPTSYEGFPSGSAVVQQFGITATCPPTPLQLNHEAPNAPLDMTTHNFPKRSKYAHRAAISAMHPYNRTRGGGGASVAKTLDLLKAVLQPSFNMEVKRLCDDYKHIYAMAASNIRENTGDTVPASTLKLLIMKMIEEAHQGYLESKWEFPTGKLPVNDKVIATKGSPMAVKKLSRTEKDSRYGPAKRQRKPPSERQNDRSSGWRWGMDRRRLDPVKWDPDKLDLKTDFVLGVNVNKALGHSANRGKVYYLHPELFKYACEGDDKTWLYENKYLPVHGGKAFLMIYSEVQTLVQTEECYKGNEDISNDLLKLERFQVPQFMIDKMKCFMRSVQGYFIQENSQNSNSSSSSAVNKS